MSEEIDLNALLAGLDDTPQPPQEPTPAPVQPEAPVVPEPVAVEPVVMPEPQPAVTMQGSGSNEPAPVHDSGLDLSGIDLSDLDLGDIPGITLDTTPEPTPVVTEPVVPAVYEEPVAIAPEPAVPVVEPEPQVVYNNATPDNTVAFEQSPTPMTQPEPAVSQRVVPTPVVEPVVDQVDNAPSIEDLLSTMSGQPTPVNEPVAPTQAFTPQTSIAPEPTHAPAHMAHGQVPAQQQVPQHAPAHMGVDPGVAMTPAPPMPAGDPYGSGGHDVPRQKKKGNLGLIGVSVGGVAVLGAVAAFGLYYTGVLGSDTTNTATPAPDTSQSAPATPGDTEVSSESTQDTQSATELQSNAQSGVVATPETSTQADAELTELNNALIGLVKGTATHSKDKDVKARLESLAQRASNAPASQDGVDYLAAQIVEETKNLARPDNMAGDGTILSVETSLQGNKPVLVVLTSQPMTISLVSNVNGKVVRFNPQNVSGAATFLLDQDKDATSGAYAFIVKGGKSEMTGVRSYKK